MTISQPTIETWTDDEFEAKRAECDEHGMQVCGVPSLHPDTRGQPVYFAVVPDAPDELVRDLAFLIQHGKPLGEAERRMIELTEQHAPGFLEVTRDERTDPDPADGAGQPGPVDGDPAVGDVDPDVADELPDSMV